MRLVVHLRSQGQIEAARIMIFWRILINTFTAVIANATELILSRREHQARIQKLNLIVGASFSEMGMDLLARIKMVKTNMDRINDIY